MSAASHTPGPWRWEVNEKSRNVQLCGGKPKYDLTVMDFERWGMNGAAPRFRDNGDHGLLTRCIKWACTVLGREHHAFWFKSLEHPDARLIAAAPDLLAALKPFANFACDTPHPPGERACFNCIARDAVAQAEGK